MAVIHPFVNDNRPYSSEELASRWGVTSQHIRDLIRAGALRHFRVGRLIRIFAVAVREFEETSAHSSNVPRREKMAEWMPIETAPKDGTMILLYRDGDHADGHWMGDARFQIWGNRRRGWSYPDWCAPTHWQPLPSPPDSQR